LYPPSTFQSHTEIEFSDSLIVDGYLSRNPESEFNAKNLAANHLFGRSFELGFGYQLNEHRLIIASRWDIEFDMRARFSSAIGKERKGKEKGGLNLRPWAQGLPIRHRV